MFCNNCGRKLDEKGMCVVCDENIKNTLYGNKNKFSNSLNIILTVLFSVVILSLVYRISVVLLKYNNNTNKYEDTIKIPYANQMITPSKNNVITDDMISYIEIPNNFKVYFVGSFYDNVEGIVGKCANFTTVIPNGSFFMADMVIDCENAKYNSYDEWYADYYGSEE